MATTQYYVTINDDGFVFSKGRTNSTKVLLGPKQLLCSKADYDLATGATRVVNGVLVHNASPKE